MAVAPAHPQDEILLATDGTLSGSARAIAFGRDAQHFAVLAKNDDRTVVALIERDDCRCDHGLSLANEPLDEVQFDGVRPIMVGPLPQDLDHRALLLMGSVARASQIAGTLEYMLARTVAYSQERVAFERKIAKFQAVQQSLARLAGETAAAVAAAESAADALAAGIAWSDPAALLEAGAAKIRSAEAAQVGAAIAHQIHGAIGTTVEYVLHRFSLRALAWRDDFGNESYWAVTLGKMLADRGPDGLWPLIASR
jgi:acyl-CoA dehydrogenase